MGETPISRVERSAKLAGVELAAFCSIGRDRRGLVALPPWLARDNTGMAGSRRVGAIFGAIFGDIFGAIPGATSLIWRRLSRRTAVPRVEPYGSKWERSQNCACDRRMLGLGQVGEASGVGLCHTGGEVMLPDYLAPGLDILFCGTAAGPTSARLGHYYARNGNRFWRLLAETGLTPRLMRPEEDHLLPGLGLGFTDLAKGVAGMDHAIPSGAFDPARVALLVAEWQPRAVAFTSLTAARLALGDKRVALGRVEPSPWPGVVVWALSSPSGANVSFTSEPWHALAAWRRVIDRAVVPLSGC